MIEPREFSDKELSCDGCTEIERFNMGDDVHGFCAGIVEDPEIQGIPSCDRIRICCLKGDKETGESDCWEHNFHLWEAQIIVLLLTKAILSYLVIDKFVDELPEISRRLTEDPDSFKLPTGGNGECGAKS